MHRRTGRFARLHIVVAALRRATTISLAGTFLVVSAITTGYLLKPTSTQTPSAGPEAGASTAAVERIRKRWPTKETSGARGTLRSIQGRTITRDGAVLRNVRVNGQLTIRADDVVLDNVFVKTSSAYGVLVYGHRAKVRDTTIEGTPGPTLAGLVAYEGGSFVARRIHVLRSEDGVRMASNCVLTDSLIHGLRGSPESHFDAVTADGYTGWRILRNRILNHHSQTAAVWVGDPRYRESAGLLKDNFIAGGGYSIYGGPGQRAGIRVIDNTFSTKHFPRSGYWGPVAYWESSGNTWSGNVWRGGRRDGSRVRP